MIFEDKLAKVKSLDRYDEGDLNELEHEYANLQVSKDYFLHPETQETYMEVRETIKQINRKLRDDYHLQNVDRAYLRGQRDQLAWFLRRYSRNYESDLKALDQELDQLLE